MTYLYKTQKNIVNDKFHSFLKVIFILFWTFAFIGLNFIVIKMSSGKFSTIILLFLSILINILGILVGSLMWVRVFRTIRPFRQYRNRKKYEYLLINLLFTSFIGIFINVFSAIYNILMFFIEDNQQENK